MHRSTHLSIIVPTRNEAGNVERLIDELERVLQEIPAEIIFVDDSDDDTPQVIETAVTTSQIAIKLIARPPHERTNGLGGAVVAGFRAAQSPWLCVMDADLQHPTALVPEMLGVAERGAADLVIASRLKKGGSTAGMNSFRIATARTFAFTTKLAFPMRLRHISDPLTGFFLLRNGAVDWDVLRPDGFKILLEIVVRSPKMRITEIPFTFGARFDGESKANLHEVVRLLRHYVKLRYSADSYLIRFLLVGLMGLLNQTALLYLLGDYVQLRPFLAFILASEATIVVNWFPIERWAFDDRRERHPVRWRFGRYLLLNHWLLCVSAVIFMLLLPTTSILPASLIAICAMTLIRWLISDLFIWKRLPSQPLTRRPSI